MNSFPTDHAKFSPELYRQTYYDDTSVDTSSYLLDYARLVERWRPVKRKLDEENAQVKVISDAAYSSRELNKTEYLVLEYTRVIGVEKFCQHFKNEKNYNNKNNEYAKEQLYVKECPFTNCRFSCDIAADMDRADALLFHEGDLKQDLEKNKNYLSELRAKVTNRAKQIWLLYNDEVNKRKKLINALRKY